MTNNDAGRGDGMAENVSVTDVLHDCLICGIINADGLGQITALNSQAEALIHLTAARVLQQPLKILPVSLAEIFSETLSKKNSISPRQVQVSGFSGRLLALRVTTQFVPASSTSVAQAIMVLNDVTPARALEHSMHRLDRLATIGTLSAGLAHELRNALVAGRTFVELLLEKQLDVELASVVRREMARIDALLSQMLKFAAPAKPSFGTLRLHELLEHSLRLVKPQLEDKTIALDRQFNAPCDQVQGDNFQLQQAFLNLFLNAIESMGAKGTLKVTTGPAESEASTSDDSVGPVRLYITVTDTGAGITPENIGRLFEPFFTTKPHGTGLGLPIARRIVQEHGGDLKVESQSGHGATFTVVLPIHFSTGALGSAPDGLAKTA
jgi:signal transduction histidine kinase